MQTQLQTRCRRLLMLAALLAAAALAQNPNTASFPTAPITDAISKVAVDRSFSTLQASIDEDDLVLTVDTGHGVRFAEYEILTIEDEQMIVCSIAGDAVTLCADTRGWNGTLAVSHSNGAEVRGNITAWPINQAFAELKAIEEFLGAAGANVPTLGASNTYASNTTQAFSSGPDLPGARFGCGALPGSPGGGGVLHCNSGDANLPYWWDGALWRSLYSSGIANRGFERTGDTFSIDQSVHGYDHGNLIVEVYDYDTGQKIDCAPAVDRTAPFAVHATLTSSRHMWIVIAGWGGPSGSASPHDLLSATHSDADPGAPVLGGLVYADATPAWTQLPGNATTTRKFLAQTGTGSVSAAPEWSFPSSSEIIGAFDEGACSGYLKSDGTCDTPTGTGSGDVTGGSSSAAGEVAAYTDTTGKAIGRSYFVLSGPASTPKTFTFPNASATVLTDNTAVTIGQGGTGQATATAAFDALAPTTTRGDLIVRDASNNVRLAKGTQYQVLLGGATDPGWGAVDLAQASAVTGILGAANGGTANGFFAVSGPASTTKTYTFPNASATVLTNNAAVTIAQGGTGQATATAAFDALAPTTTRGDLIVRDASNNVRLAKGTQYQVLLGGATDPGWGAVDLAQASAVTGILGAANGGTSNGFFAVSGPASSTKTYTFPNASATVSYTVASGTASLGTGAISSTACATVVTVSATGVATTDVITFTPNADITAVTGYAPATTGGLAIYPYPTADNVNFKVCNPTSSSITPGAVTLNWRVVR